MNTKTRHRFSKFSFGRSTIVRCACFAALALLAAACEPGNEILEPTAPPFGSTNLSEHTAPEVRTIVVDPPSANLPIGGAVQLSAEEWWPSGGITTDPDVTWRTTNASVARVSDDGRVTAISEGTATISAARSGREGDAEIRVGVSAEPENPSADEDAPSEDNPPEERTVTVDPSSASLEVEQVVQLSATEWWPSGTVTSDPDVNWSSSDESVAVVNESGRVRAAGHGTVTISAARGGRSGEAVIRVGDGQGSGSSEDPSDNEQDSGGAEPPPPPPPSGGMIPAFPGAEGYGAAALNSCNRSNTHVFRVTSRNNSGSGTLRRALADAEAAPARDLKVIVFQVGGYIDVSNRLQYGSDCLYLAGQTAPGDGITLRGHGFELHEGAQDVVVRYIRIRTGESGNGSGIMVRSGSNQIFDHLSVSWTPLTLMRFSRTHIGRSGPIRNVTIQRSLLGESLASHSTAIQIGGTPNNGSHAGWKDITHFSIHNNAMVHNHHRSPNVRGLYIEVVNNVIHNWSLDAGQTAAGAIVDWIGNFVQKGPMSRLDRVPFGVRDQHLVEEFVPSALHVAGNVSVGGERGSHSARDEPYYDQITNPTVNNWTTDVVESRSTAMGLVDWYHNDDLSRISFGDLRRTRSLTSLTSPAEFPVRVQDPYRARDSILNDVGAVHGLDCRGNWDSRMDAVDQRLIRDVRNADGPANGVNHEGEVGGFPSLRSGAACADSNGDGIPDAWKERHGLDPRDSSIASRIGAGGYTYVEHYLNGTRP